MKKVSLIIPVYNCVKYLDECFKSVISQTFGIENMEVIIVDDGSTDGCKNKIQEYCNKYKDWIFINQENHGVAHARNTGLDKVTTEYIIFLDSDDYLDNNAVQILYENITLRKNITMAIGRMEAFDLNNRYPYYSDKILKKSRVANYKMYPQIVSMMQVCSKIFKTDFIKKLRFINDVKHEDVYFMCSLFLKNELFAVIPEVIYYRRYRDGENHSITQNIDLKVFKDLLINYNKVIEENNVKYKFIKFTVKKINKYLYSKLDKKDWKIAETLTKNYIKDLYLKDRLKLFSRELLIIYNYIFSRVCIVYINLKRKKVKNER